jgi:16S rRNA U1498 N3-methylase RsmE
MFKVGDRVIVMVGSDHPARGEVIEIKDKFVKVRLDALWPPEAEPQEKWYGSVELMKAK